MAAPGYNDVFGIDLTAPEHAETRVGQKVKFTDNDGPYYRVIAVDGDRAWVRSLTSGADHIGQTRQVRVCPEEEA